MTTEKRRTGLEWNKPCLLYVEKAMLGATLASDSSTFESKMVEGDTSDTHRGHVSAAVDEPGSELSKWSQETSVQQAKCGVQRACNELVGSFFLAAPAA